MMRRPSPVFSEEYRAMIAVVKSARQSAGLSQRALAERIGKTNSHVNVIERGQRRLDALELIVIARALGLRPSELLERIDRRLEELGGPTPSQGVART